MPAYFFLLKCPKCGKEMKYHTQSALLSDKRKSCVFCGKSFKAKDHLVKKI